MLLISVIIGVLIEALFPLEPVDDEFREESGSDEELNAIITELYRPLVQAMVIVTQHENVRIFPFLTSFQFLFSVRRGSRPILLCDSGPARQDVSSDVQCLRGREEDRAGQKGLPRRNAPDVQTNARQATLLFHLETDDHHTEQVGEFERSEMNVI